MSVLTQSTAFLIGPVASLLGIIMNGIFWVQTKIGIPNIGLCIILFTIVIYMLMTPLTIQQQKFSRLQAKMNPEIQAIQKKYKNKKDQVSMQKMNEETQAIYAKYGVNPMGSCLQLLIQMPILFALYRVIWNIPAYVTSVKDAFMPLAEKMMTTPGVQDYLTEVSKTVGVSFKEMTNLTIIDVLYKFKPANWTELSNLFPDLGNLITDTQSKLGKFNSFLGLDIADSPANIVMTGIKAGTFLIVIGAVMIPLLAGVTQWLNAKLMTNMQSSSNSGREKSSTESSVESSMKMMNTMMPIMSAVFCITFPVGLGIYWIAGAVVRSVQQLVINKKIDSMDMDEIMKKNLEKLNKKREKQGLQPQQMNDNAKLNTKKIEANGNVNNKKFTNKVDLSKEAANIDENVGSKTKAKPGSLAAKAMMVKEFNEKNQRK